MQITVRPIFEIKPYWRNPRINHAVIDALKESISEFGFNQPIVIDENNIVIVGHARLKACIELGFKEVPCVRVSLGASKAKKYRIADNKLAEISEWDMKSLIPELRELDAKEMAIFFPKENLEQMLQESVGAMNYKYPTEEQIAKVESDTKSRFENEYKKSVEAELAMMCPHCGETFKINKTLL